MEAKSRYSEARRITLAGAAKNVVLAFLKIVCGITGHSHALFADGVHSLSDLLIDTLVLIASHFGSKAADSDHPYGHGRIETAATVLLAFLMSFAGIGIVVDAVADLVGTHISIKPNFYVLLVALFSILVNEVLYFYTRRVGEKVQSNLLIANAWHHRSDSASSLVVFIGAGGAWLGFGFLDPIAAIIVGLMIVKMAWQFGWNSIRELVDTGLDEEVLQEIRKTISKVPGVIEVHQLRTRSLASKIFLDVHVLVDPMLSVSEGHYIGEQVHVRLLDEMRGISDVTVHVDPEDDERVAPSLHLPTRAEIVSLLTDRWQRIISPEVNYNVTLHYLNGRVIVEVRLPLSYLKSQADITQWIAMLRQAVSDVAFIASVEVLFS